MTNGLGPSVTLLLFVQIGVGTLGAQERVAYLLELHNREALREAKRSAVGKALLDCLQ